MSRSLFPKHVRVSSYALLALLAACQPAKPPAAAAPPTKIPITTASEEARALYLKGRDLSEQIHPTEANALFAQAVAKDPGFALAHWSMAQTANTTKDFFEHLNAAVAGAEKVSEGERLLILILQAGANGDRPKALQYSEELVAKYPNDERAHTVLGNGYMGRQEYDKAVAEFQKAVAIAPTYSPAYNLLGYAYRPIGKYPEAEQAFKKYIELVPNDANPYDSYAELLLKMGRFDESIAQYQKALSLDPNFSSSRLGISWDMTLQGKHDAALTEADKALAAARNDGEKRAALFSRAATLLDQGKPDLAVKEMEKSYALGAAIGDTGGMAGDAGSIGDILLESGQADQAMKRYQQQLDLITASSLSQDVKDNTKSGNHFDRARVALKKGDLKTAKAEATEYMTGATAKQNDAQLRAGHQLMGMIAVAEKQPDAALTELAQANQQDAYTLFQMGMAQMAKGDKAKAKELFQSAANMNILPTLNYALVRAKAKKMAGM